jgi:hypothetical protein
MKQFFLDKLTVVLAVLTFSSYFFQRDFFYGLLLFYINLISFNIIVSTLFKLSSEDNRSIKKYIFIPAIIIKMLSIGGISYLVLVYLNGSPYYYMGGFCFGLAIFTLGLSISNVSKKVVAPEEK